MVTDATKETQTAKPDRPVLITLAMFALYLALVILPAPLLAALLGVADVEFKIGDEVVSKEDFLVRGLPWVVLSFAVSLLFAGLRRRHIWWARPRLRPDQAASNASSPKKAVAPST